MHAGLHDVCAMLTMKSLLVREEAICPACGSPRLPFEQYCVPCQSKARQLWAELLSQASDVNLDTGAFPLFDEGSMIL